jgi:endonuclease/exonuclease/phosphatase (EEP) superfamily protein YafD
VLGIAYVGARFPGPFALFDDLSNFPVHFGLAFIACAALHVVRRQAAWAAGAIAAAALAIAPVVPWFFGADAAPADPAKPWVKFLASNVYFANHQHRLIKDLIAKEDPDLVGLVEVNSRWLHRLKPLREWYPYHFEVPDENYVGLALYSRLPLEDARVLQLPGEPSTPAIAATLKAPGGDVEIVLVHPMSPLSAEIIRRRNEQILALAKYVRAAGRPLVIAGDFNLSMWNAGYRPLTDVAELHNARQGSGIGPTWPSVWRLGVPIDHILATPDVALRNFRVLGGIGSDHFPISAEFSHADSVAAKSPGIP